MGEHEPLEDAGSQIRLLALRPTKSQRIHISTWKLEDAPPYKAISYHWGPLSPVHSVTIGSDEIDVQPNCFAALWHARHHFVRTRGSVPHYFWIDSICIDQTNIPEKNQQVQLMGRIFEKAESVLACVGGIEQYNKRFNLEEPEPRLQFLEQKYWSRLWIIQELYLAKRIHVLYGCHLLMWSAVEELQKWAEPYKRVSPYLPRLIQFLMRSAKHGFPNMLLQDAMCMFSDFHCLDRMDHVYGLLGITDHNNTPDQPSAIRVDYSRSLLSLARLVLSTCRRHPYEYLPAVRETLRALRIRPDDEDLMALMSYWQPLRRLESSCSLLEPDLPQTILTDLEKVVQDGDAFRQWISSSTCLRHGAQVKLGEQDHLLAEFEPAKEHSVKVAPDHGFMTSQGNTTLTTAIIDAVCTASWPVNLLYSGDQVAAVASMDTQPGDWLIHSFLSDSHFVVARHSGGSIYQIVGHGIALPEYRPPVDTSVIKDSGISITTFTRRATNDHERNFTLMLSEEDAFALGAHYAGLNCEENPNDWPRAVNKAVTHSTLSSFVYSSVW